MTGLHLLAFTPAFGVGLLVGAGLVGALTAPMRRRAEERGREAQRVLDFGQILGAAPAQLVAAPPSSAWSGPRALLHRAARLRLDRLFAGVWTEPVTLSRPPLLDLRAEPVPMMDRQIPAITMTEAICGIPVRTVLLAEPVPPRVPIGAEPVPASNEEDRSGLTSPAASARTLGNAAPPLDAQPPPLSGAAAGPSDSPWTVHGRDWLHHPGRQIARHAADPDEVGEVTGEFWAIVGTSLFVQGLTPTDPALALPCSHCEVDHVGCVGCACPCKLAEVA